MYNYFASKEKLLDEIIQQGFNSLSELEFKAKKGVDPKKQLEEFVDSVLENLYSNFNYWQLYLALLVHPEIQKKFERKMQQFREEFTNALALNNIYIARVIVRSNKKPIVSDASIRKTV